MKRNITTIVLSMISLIIFSSCNIYGIVIPKDSTNMNRMIIGIWEGTLKVSGIELRVVFSYYTSHGINQDIFILKKLGLQCQVNSLNRPFVFD